MKINRKLNIYHALPGGFSEEGWVVCVEQRGRQELLSFATASQAQTHIAQRLDLPVHLLLDHVTLLLAHD
jgi:hypothetical protein